MEIEENYDYQDFGFNDYESAKNAAMLLQAHKDAASAVVKECDRKLSAVAEESERKLQENNKRFADTIETLKKQVVAAMAEAAKAKQEATEWRKAYEDLAKCL